VTVDLNADVGEGLDDVDRLLLESVTSASVACGFHAGGEETARRLCAAALERGMAIGAHVGYRDRDGFGRRELGIPAGQVEAETCEQVAALRAWGGEVSYVKPHGALYHRMRRDPECAVAIRRAAGGLPVLGLDVAEGFADRRYAADGTLLPRGEPGAVLGPEESALQAVRLAREGRVRSICVHGDSPRAVEVAARVRAALTLVGAEVARFA
jgi:5-oxoprolinase (ATP-hydrolysing) subunit A